MSSILRDHALLNIWAEPAQDRQYRIRPSRITTALGASKDFTFIDASYRLPGYNNPTDRRTFHIYPLGKIPPYYYRVERMEMYTWYRLDELAIANGTVIDVIGSNGSIVPSHLCWLMDCEGSPILAVERTTIDLGSLRRVNAYQEIEIVPFNFDRGDLTVRFYHNAIQSSEHWINQNSAMNKPTLNYLYQQVTSSASFLAFKQKVDKLKAEYRNRATVNYYADGFLITEPKAFNSKVNGKLLSCWFDLTGRETQIFPVKTLPAFKSIKDDGFNKLLVMSKNDSYDQIDFNDDLDFYLVRRYSDGTSQGVKLDRLYRNVIRQVTHTAWAVRADIIDGLVTEHDFLINNDTLELHVMIRDGGMRHKLGFQANRIEDLYHLPREQRLEAMAERDSNLAIWRASNLENSCYIEVMSSDEKYITDEMVDCAYGYHAATKAVNRTLYPVESAAIRIDQGLRIAVDSKNPNVEQPSFKTKTTVFWYNADRHLLGWSEHDKVNIRIEVPAEYLRQGATLAEVFLMELQEDYGESGTVMDREIVEDKTYGFYGARHYVSSMDNGRIVHDWDDVTGSAYVTAFPSVNGKPPYYKWNYKLLSQAGYIPATRIASKMNVLEFEFDINSDSGMFELPLMSIDDIGVSTIGVPPGHIDVFMDGVPLIPELDFRYKTGGTVVVTKQVEDAEEVKFVVRYYGYMCPLSRKNFAPRDTGFVMDGVLSKNKVFNTIHDRHVRINVGGKIYRYGEVSFAEDKPNGNLLLDGAPYVVEDYQVTIEHFMTGETIPRIKDAMIIDKQVSDYLTPRLGEPDRVDPFIEGDHWRIYSPTFSTFIHLMVTGVWSDAVIDRWDTDFKMLDGTRFYVDRYAEIEPLTLGVNQDYVAVYPTPFRKHIPRVTRKQHAALERLNRLHFHGAINLANSVEIIAGT